MSAAKILKGVGIGAGYFAPYHYHAWTRMPEISFLAVADLDEKKARTVSERYGIPRWYTDYRAMLDAEQPDFVDIVTPPQTHLSIGLDVAGRGLPMICQKPLAPTYEAAEQLVDLIDEAGVRFMVHENWRWQPWYREARRLIDTDVLGDVSALSFCMRTGDGWPNDAYLDRQPYFRDYQRLLVFETGVHFIDTFRYLLGEIDTVYARLRRLNTAIRGEDSGHLVFGHESGATALLDANRYNEPHTDPYPRYTFGTMRIDASKGHLLLNRDGTLDLKLLGRPAKRHAFTPSHEGFAGDSVAALQRHFVEALLGNTPFESHGRDYLRTLCVVEACYASAFSGTVQTVEYPDDA